MQAKFIYVQDEKAKNKLLSLGYRLIQHTSDWFIFENNLSYFNFNNKSKDSKVDFEYMTGNTLLF
jgi:hypothetical protein